MTSFQADTGKTSAARVSVQRSWMSDQNRPSQSSHHPVHSVFSLHPFPLPLTPAPLNGLDWEKQDENLLTSSLHVKKSQEILRQDQTSQSDRDDMKIALFLGKSFRREPGAELP